MICRASEKVAGGKLVRLELEHDGSRIVCAKITGDFFLHPEDALAEIENSLAGTDLRSPESAFSARISRITSSSSAEMVGFSPEILARLIVRAIASCGAGERT
ncbi:Lipoate-protein ligase A subunit 2 [uncultured archaeon]|nr:Lipoate-protein ligase A subunit 2 [uncultured archaeon]